MSIVLAIDCIDGMLLAADSLGVHKHWPAVPETLQVGKVRRLGEHHVWSMTGRLGSDGAQILFDPHAVDVRGGAASAEQTAGAIAQRLADATTAKLLAGGAPEHFGNQVVVVSNYGGAISRALCSVTPTGAIETRESDSLEPANGAYTLMGAERS